MMDLSPLDKMNPPEVKCYIVFLIWHYRVNEVIVSVPHCAPKEARIKKGMPEFSCMEMHQGEFENFARVIDEKIQVECLFAPPDPHPENLFCRWRFVISDK